MLVCFVYPHCVRQVQNTPPKLKMLYAALTTSEFLSYCPNSWELARTRWKHQKQFLELYPSLSNFKGRCQIVKLVHLHTQPLCERRIKQLFQDKWTKKAAKQSRLTEVYEQSFKQMWYTIKYQLCNALVLLVLWCNTFFPWHRCQHMNTLCLCLFRGWVVSSSLPSPVSHWKTSAMLFSSEEVNHNTVSAEWSTACYYILLGSDF